MGIEYSIRCQLPKNYDAQTFFSRLDNPKDQNGWTAFVVSLEPYGFYFCDNCWSEQATKAFRRIVDEALLHSDTVTIDQA
jgi:hypothetical protein